ncbi:MAG: DUF1192 domain-containing protein [Beijerinckiaceae bacterium]|nr:DUF1192 domain-containing protein [Beijerinckiaceae bacterium]
MARHDEEDSLRPVGHEIGAKLDDLSIFELDARINLLRTEIARLEAAKTRKEDAAKSASSFFKS